MTNDNWAAQRVIPPRAPVPTAPRHAPVSPATTAVFGRPDGVDGSFDSEASAKAATAGRAQPTVAAPDPVLAEAFSRPSGSTETLARDPDARYGEVEVAAEPVDPWRDPASPAHLSAPAKSRPDAVDPVDPGPKLGVREVLLGHRISWQALLSLSALAVTIGLLGALVGAFFAGDDNSSRGQTVTLPADSGKGGDEPRSMVARVVRAVEKAVVAIDVRTTGSSSTGSGVIIDKAGYIVTNNHVVAMAAEDKTATTEVVFYDRTRVPAKIVGRDPKSDLAVVKVDNVANITVATLGDSDKVQIGENVVAFGSPLGLDRTVTSGIVSAVNRALALPPGNDSDTDAVIDAIQTDAAINPGNSGGPLVDSQARVIGINSMIQTTSGGSMGLGFAIPINQVRPIAQTIIAHGKVVHPSIGLTATSVRNQKVLGARVANVVAGSPAERAQIREGDVITKFNGRPIESSDELSVAVRGTKIGEKVDFTYWRDGRTFTGSIVPDGD
ncbi:MAG TPA: trypsin-like peptidase domain-containing protein [Gordonia sp. (in: high G+C Gram-positive bacteria)]|uniref:S1C family serine protease n=1 Tax=unclassified Gordonia (in: high G+C Gram-positive bacteria) TaxID=2657482 RepID=UPI000F95AF96|nr:MULTISPECIES: trypsin-like peptidase domain-containing protein [unclassified Gordonia (in: high G+C Gram-positive bacteria)]RUP35464.1 MAG: PDZ domain-containing protein [Gordonia sp. (in: high G+C Gram-positive bacteria)]HNP57810.1 trypsin-like peptidase domain-containing protein [Gordonia sp. (in: high G+C Gram-positive bacteria)]HRC51269.1 trypsin-like peptidase domain-containing protein [Gordonia sp. (in: high G+C Gram-positive bacteria)]